MRRLKRKRIDAIKLNYNIDRSLQRFSQYECQIEISKDFEFLNIYNRKPCDLPIFQSRQKHTDDDDDGSSEDMSDRSYKRPACHGRDNHQKELADELFNEFQLHKS